MSFADVAFKIGLERRSIMPNERKDAIANYTPMVWGSRSLSVKDQPPVPDPSVPSSSSVAAKEFQLDFAKYDDENLVI